MSVLTDEQISNEAGIEDFQSDNPTGTMHIMSGSGDTELKWNKDNEVEVENARKVFKRLTQKAKYLAYALEGDGSKGEVIHSFDPNQERLVLAPQHVGG